MRFEVGEEIELRSRTGAFSGWVDRVVMGIEPSRPQAWIDYGVPVGTTLYFFETGLFATADYMRKKRPPADYIPLEVRDLFKIGETA